MRIILNNYFAKSSIYRGDRPLTKPVLTCHNSYMMRNKVNTGETMTDKTISVNGKDFTITPDKSEVLDTLIKSYPNQTAFTRAEIKEALDGFQLLLVGTHMGKLLKDEISNDHN